MFDEIKKYWRCGPCLKTSIVFLGIVWACTFVLVPVWTLHEARIITAAGWGQIISILQQAILGFCLATFVVSYIGYQNGELDDQ